MLCVDKSWKYYAKWKKPDTKGHILYVSIYMSVQSIESQNRLVVAMSWGDEAM